MAKKKRLQEVTDQWMQLERKTFEQRRIAEEFYDTNLMQLIKEDYVKRNKCMVYEKVDYLVVSVGISYEPIVLNITLLKPKRILFLFTDQSERILDKIVKLCELVPTSYDKRRISETNPLSIYQEIKNSYLKWKQPQKMYIDFTGGTKAMSVAAAMAGAMINVQLIYVGTNDYLPDFRKPNPGSETLYYIANPLAVFGDLEIEKALTLFSQYNYSGAQEKLVILKDEIPDPNIRQEMNFVYLLAKTYEAWDALDFVMAYEFITQLNRQLKRDRLTHNTFLLMDYQDVLMEQELILDQLKTIPELVRKRENRSILKNGDQMTALMFSMCQNALIREKQEKYDMATLLFYRLLEMIEQRRLSGYGLYVSKMNYMEIAYRNNQTPEMRGLSAQEQFVVLKEKISRIKEGVFNKKTSDYLPDQVSLLEGFIILAALGDPIVNGRTKIRNNYVSMDEKSDSGAENRAEKKTEVRGEKKTETRVEKKIEDKKVEVIPPHRLNMLKRIRTMVFLRNNSIFAHGLGPVGQADFERFKNFVLDLFQEFCQIENIDYAVYRENMNWINPMKSIYYTRGI